MARDEESFGPPRPASAQLADPPDPLQGPGRLPARRTTSRLDPQAAPRRSPNLWLIPSEKPPARLRATDPRPTRSMTSSTGCAGCRCSGRETANGYSSAPAMDRLRVSKAPTSNSGLRWPSYGRPLTVTVPLWWPVQAHDRPHRRGLARPVRTQESRHASRHHVKRNVVHRDRIAIWRTVVKGRVDGPLSVGGGGVLWLRLAGRPSGPRVRDGRSCSYSGAGYPRLGSSHVRRLKSSAAPGWALLRRHFASCCRASRGCSGRLASRNELLEGLARVGEPPAGVWCGACVRWRACGEGSPPAGMSAEPCRMGAPGGDLPAVAGELAGDRDRDDPVGFAARVFELRQRALSRRCARQAMWMTWGDCPRWRRSGASPTAGPRR